MTSTVESPFGVHRSIQLVTGSMVPDPSALADVLPTDRLNQRAKPTRPLRDELRHFSNTRNATTVIEQTTRIP